MVSPVADFVVDMGSDGRILSQGSLSNALAHDAKLLKELQQEQEEIAKAKQELDKETPDDDKAKQSAGKLVVEEETELGHVGLKASKYRGALTRCLDVLTYYFVPVWLYLGNVSKQPAIFWFIYIGLWCVRHLITNVQVRLAFLPSRHVVS